MTTQKLRQPSAPHKPVTNHQRWLPWLVVGGMAVTALVVFMMIAALLVLVMLSSERMPSGVQVAGVPVGGKSVEAAADLLRANLGDRLVTFTDGDRSWQLTLSQIGARLDVDATLQAAQTAAAGAVIQPKLTIDLGQAQFGLLGLSEQANVAATNDRPGRSMDIPVSLDRLRVDASGELADGIFELDMFIVEALPDAATSTYTGQTTRHIVERGEELGLIAKQYNVSVQDIASLNGITNPDLLYVGQELTIPAAGVYQPTAADAPAPPTSVGKAIVVSTDQQRIYAFENGQLIRSHLTSTGLPATPTVKGDYKIYVKYVADDMQGADYFLPQVPYTMYFYRGYGIHGTYWHNNFGRPMSHGCVNLPVGEAEWFFNWAEVGTPVRVV